MSTAPVEYQPDGANPVEHNTVILARLNAGDPDLVAFGLGDEPNPLPDFWAIPHIGRAFGPGNPRGGGHRGSQDWRVTVRAGARTSGGCLWVLYEIGRALEGRALEVVGDQTSLLDFESSRLPELGDDGYYTAAVTYTYTH